jgi:hypothetical protein
MNLSCSRSIALFEELRSGTPSAESLSHLSVCEICMGAWMQHHLQEHARRAPDLKTLPSASLVWWKAEIIAKRKALHRSGVFIRLATILFFSCGVLILGSLGVWLWATLGSGQSVETSSMTVFQTLSALLGISALTFVGLWWAARNVPSFRIRP